jgi:hypothetical protein
MVEGARACLDLVDRVSIFATIRMASTAAFCSSASARHRYRLTAPRSSLSGLARPPGCHSRSMPTCYGTRPDMPLRGAALIPGPCRPSWGTGQSPIRSSTRPSPTSASGISGIAKPSGSAGNSVIGPQPNSDPPRRGSYRHGSI